MQLSSGLRGRIAELYFDKAFLEGDWYIAKPLFEGLPFDRLVCPGMIGPWVRVQIKRAYPRKDGSLVVNMHRSGDKPYMWHDADLLAAVYPDTDSIWLVPWHLVCDVTRKVIGAQLEPYKLGPNMAGALEVYRDATINA